MENLINTVDIDTSTVSEVTNIVRYVYETGSSFNTWNFTVPINARVSYVTVSSESSGGSWHTNPQRGTFDITYVDGTTETVVQDYTVEATGLYNRFQFYALSIRNGKVVTQIKFTYKDGSSGNTYNGRTIFIATTY